MQCSRMRVAATLAVAAALVLLLVSVVPVRADTFGTKIDAGDRECYTEMLEAGGTLGFTFRVTDGGSFDIDATMTASSVPPLKDLRQTSRFHYNEFYMALRDRTRATVVNEWKRASEGSHSYTAPSAVETKHGLPTEITVCFDNHFSTTSPKWVRFTFMKRDVLEVDPDSVTQVEAEMEKKLHRYGTIMFDLAQDADRLRLTGEADRVKANAVSQIIITGLVANVLILILMAVYQYYSLTRFLNRQKNAQRVKAHTRK